MTKKLKAKGQFTVVNERGLHTRPSTELVKCASQYKAEVFLHCQDNVVNAKSLLGILTLAASRGTKIHIEAAGEDAEEAVEAIIGLARNKFHLNY